MNHESEQLSIRETREGVEFSVIVQPRSQRSEISGIRQSSVVVRLAAAPAEGAANRALVQLLAEELGVPVRAIAIVYGERQRHKRIRVVGLSAADVKARLTHRLVSAQSDRRRTN